MPERTRSWAGKGNDTLDGGVGNDTYRFNLGDGQDTVNDYDSTSNNLDTIQLGAGLTAANTEVVRNGNDLVLRWVGNNSDSVTVKNVFNAWQVQFAQPHRGGDVRGRDELEHSRCDGPG